MTSTNLSILFYISKLVDSLLILPSKIYLQHECTNISGQLWFTCIYWVVLAESMALVSGADSPPSDGFFV